MKIALCTAALATLWLVACSDDGARGVLHLDPRLADGRSSAEVLAGQRTLIESWELRGETPQLGPWSVDGKADCTVGGLRLLRASGDAVPALVFERSADPLDAGVVNTLELELDGGQPGRALLRWRPEGEPADSWPPLCALEVLYDGAEPAAPAGAARTLRFALARHPQWQGRIAALRLEPDRTRSSSPRLRALRLVTQGWSMGFEPLQEELLAQGQPRRGGDGGLVAFELEARRAWPADFGVPLLARLEVPEDAMLHCEVALTPALRESTQAVHFAIDARTSGRDWTRLVARTIVPFDKPSETLWRPLRADLGAYAGQQLELRWSAFEGELPQAGALLAESGAGERAEVLWGTPLVVPRHPAEPLPNILLVTLDTTRADALGAYSASAHTPFFDHLAEQGVVFENAFSPTNATQPGHASILTSSYLHDHGVVNNYSVLAAPNLCLAEMLRELGYFTAAAVGQPCLDAGTGFGQGFDTYLQAAPEAFLDGAVTIRGVRAWFDQWQLSGAPPFFLWLHLYDAHTPYTPQPEWLATLSQRSGQSLPERQPTPPTLPELDLYPPEMAFLKGVSSLEYARALYRAEVSYTDALVENLAARLSELDWLGSTAFVLTADHGESLGEQNNWFNHKGLFPEVVRVPLIFAWPGQAQGQRHSAPVSTVDIAPTLLRLLGLPMPGSRGLDLFEQLRTGSKARRTVFFEHSDELQAGLDDGSAHLIETLSSSMTFGLRIERDAQGRRVPAEFPLEQGRVQLFDRGMDPSCEVDLAAAQGARRRALQAELEAWRQAARPIDSIERAVTPEERDALEKLGYTSR